jgi:hypothetical protein
LASGLTAAAAQTPDVLIHVAARPDADAAAGAPFHALWTVDGVLGGATPILGLPDALVGRENGVYVPGAGPASLGRDENTGRLLCGTRAAAAGAAYGVYSVALDAAGASATHVDLLASWIATAAGEEATELEWLSDGGVLVLRTRPASAGGFVGVERVDPLGGATTWPFLGAPALEAAGLAYDPADGGGTGGFYVVFSGPSGVENLIFKAPHGGGAAEFLSAFTTAIAPGDAPGPPTSLTICPTGNLIVTHGDATACITAVNRTTGVATLGWRDLWSTGLVACEIDLVRDADVVLGAGPGAGAREVRRLRLPEGGVPETLATLPSGLAVGVAATSGVRMFGRAGSPPGQGFLRAGLLGTAVAGNASFGFRCTGGTPNMTGALWLGLTPESYALTPFGLPGALFTWPDLLWAPLAFDGNGRAEAPLPLPWLVPAGLKAYAQFLDPARPAASAGLRLSFF